MSACEICGSAMDRNVGNCETCGARYEYDERAMLVLDDRMRRIILDELMRRKNL